MHRRTLLRVGAGVVGGAVSGRASAAGRASPPAGRTAALGSHRPAGVAGEPTDDAYGPVGSVELPEAREAVVAGDVAYVATTDGYSVLRLGDRPTVIATRSGLGPSDGEFRFIWDVAYDDDRLLVPAQGRRSDHTLGFTLEDVSDPANPTTTHTVETQFSIHNAVLDGETAFLTGGDHSTDAVTLYDVAGEPARLGSWSVIDAEPDYEFAYEAGPTAHDLAVTRVGGRRLAAIACWDAGTWLVDLTDPADPTALGQAGGVPPLELAQLPSDERKRQGTIPPGNHHNATFGPDGELLVVGKESWALEVEGSLVGGPSGLDLFDVSDPTDPEQLATIPAVRPPNPDRFDGVTTTAHNVSLAGDTLYSSWYRGGVKRHDLSDPTDPQLETYWRAPNAASFWAARTHQPGETFLAVSRPFESADGTQVPGAVYLFPDEPGRSVTPFPGETTDQTATADGTATATEPTDGTATEPTDETATARQTDDSTTATTGDGFGLLAGIAGLAGALAARRRSEE